MRGKALTEFQKNQIINLKEDEKKKWKWTEIAKAVNSTESACRQFYYRSELKKSLPPKPVIKDGITKGRIGLAIKKVVKDKPNIPYRDIPPELRKTLNDETSIPCPTVCREYLILNGLRMVRLQKKPLIHPRNLDKRVKFGEFLLRNGPSFWDRIVWSDETMVRCNPVGKVVRMWTHQSDNPEDLPVSGQVQGGGFGVMFWGCFSRAGLGPLVPVEGSMNGEKYKEMMGRLLLPYLGSCGDMMMFMQDNAPCHSSNVAKDFFKAKGVQVLPWPPQSPDLNPIENLWAIIKARRQKAFGFPKNKDQLIEQISQIWDNLEQELVDRLLDSMENRFSEVIRLKGKPINY